MDADDLLRMARDGLCDGDFTLLYLWISFRARGGGADKADLDAAFRGLQGLADEDALVLGSVLAEIHCRPAIDSVRPELRTP